MEAASGRYRQGQRLDQQSEQEHGQPTSTSPSTTNQPLAQPSRSTQMEHTESKVADKQQPQSQVPPVPTKEQFDIPTTEEAYERMVERLASVGLAKWEVDKAIEAKTTAFNRACREHKKLSTELKKKTDPKQATKSRKNSLN